MNSQGPPRSGSLPQIWGNGKFQNWGNSPDLEKLQIFDQYFVMEKSIVTSYNYSGKCLIYWRRKKIIVVPRQGNRKKNIQTKPTFCRENCPRSGETPQISGKYSMLLIFPQIQGISLVLGQSQLLKDSCKSLSNS